MDHNSYSTPQIDYYLFQRQFGVFREFVEEQSGVLLTSFAANPYTEQKEGYKYDIYRAGRDALTYPAWQKTDIGKGEIIGSVIEAIEIPGNNLVPWQSRYGDDRRPHQPLYALRDQPEKVSEIETAFYHLYKTEEDAASFEKLIDIFGKSYPLLAYFYFLKDRARYLPIGPTAFDRAFDALGIEFITAQKCSWENYSAFISIIKELKAFLSERLDVEVTLLDAHSFCWILAGQMTDEDRVADVSDYRSRSETEREAINKARIGQGQFRRAQLDEWSACAVTGFRQPNILEASHIKPWKESTNEEKLNRYNGILLSPDIHALFDEGYISFNDDGSIIISGRLDISELEKLGLYPSIRLDHIKEQHKPFLAYHRENILE